jgi:hypothetical protein
MNQIEFRKPSGNYRRRRSDPAEIFPDSAGPEDQGRETVTVVAEGAGQETETTETEGAGPEKGS